MKGDSRRRFIISSSHLASPGAEELSELEYGLIVCWHAFQKWMVRAMAASGMPELSALDVLVLHSVYHRGRPKKLADLCLVLNIEDTHLVNYSLKKLSESGLVDRTRSGRDVTFYVTPKGDQVCQDYKRVREECLLAATPLDAAAKKQLADMAQVLRGLSGYYDQAARAATSL